MKLCAFLNAISQKVIEPKIIPRLRSDVAQCLVSFELVFPPSFFKIVTHVLVHLVDEIVILGPVFLHNMIPFERFMGVLKKYVLGNIVISKNFLRTRKIMVMHSNKRGECSPRTQRRPTAEAMTRHRGSSRTSSRSNRSSTETTTPPSSAHIQLDDVPRTPIQRSFTGEFCQHDG